MSLASERGGILGSLANERQRILASTSGRDVRDSLAKERAGILSSLAGERQRVFSGVRGDSPGPQTFVRNAPVDYGSVSSSDPYIAALQERYAQQRAAAQTAVNEAMLNGGDFIYGSPKQTMAKMERQRLASLAAQEFNSRLAPNDPRRKDVMANVFLGA